MAIFGGAALAGLGELLDESLAGGEALLNDTPAIEKGVEDAANPLDSIARDVKNTDGNAGENDKPVSPRAGLNGMLDSLTGSVLRKIIANAALFIIGLVIIFTALADKNQKLILNVAKDAAIT